MSFSVDPATGFMPHHAPARSPFGLGLRVAKQAESVLPKLYQACTRPSSTWTELLEINPLVVTKAGELVCLDAKIGFDDSALYRHPDIAALRDPTEEDAKEIEAVALRSQLHRARRHHRLHGQRRRSRHGDDGHHQALWRDAGQLPRCRRRRHQGTR